MLIKRVYEIDPLICPRCSGQMKVIAFIEPPQGEVIEKILRAPERSEGRRTVAPGAHRAKTVRATTRTKIRTAGRPLPTRARERMFVDIDTCDATF